jgi:hypothetical protein
MTFDQFLVTYYTQTTLSAIVATVALVRFKTRSIPVRLIGFSFLLSFFCNGLAFALYKTGHAEYVNVPQNFFLILNICIIIGLYYHVLTPNFRGWLFTALAICVPFSFYDFVIQHKSFMNSYFPFTQSMFILTFTILYFYKLLVDMPAIHLNRLPMFWFNSAFLFFHAGTLFLWAFTSYLMHVLNDNMRAYWSFHNGVSILEHIIILIGLFFDFKALEKDSRVGTI